MITKVLINPTKSDTHWVVNGKMVKVTKPFSDKHEILSNFNLNKSEQIACSDFFGKPQITSGANYTITILKSKL